MANSFDAPLPSVGQKPWTLNPAIIEMRNRQGTVEDVINTGRLSPSGLAEAIGEAASGIEANDTTVADLIATPTSETSAAVDAKIDPVASDVSDLNTLTSTGRLGEAGLSATFVPVVKTAVLTRDGAGRITSAVENGVTVTYTRDAQGRIQSETKNGKTTTYTRDASGRVSGWETV